jgi:hypothetical protein
MKDEGGRMKVFRTEFPSSFIPPPSSLLFAGVTQLVECDLAKVDVAGSSPVSRSLGQR